MSVIKHDVWSDNTQHRPHAAYTFMSTQLNEGVLFYPFESSNHEMMRIGRLIGNHRHQHWNGNKSIVWLMMSFSCTICFCYFLEKETVFVCVIGKIDNIFGIASPRKINRCNCKNACVHKNVQTLLLSRIFQRR